VNVKHLLLSLVILSGVGCVTTDPNKITIYKDHNYELPDSNPAQPNDATIWYYYSRNDTHRYAPSRNIIVEPAPESVQFDRAVESHPKIDAQLARSTVLSYLYLESGKVIYDAVPPKDRFKGEITNDSYFVSNSVGKSVTSYILGHAICEGYIESVDAPIQDWPLMESTLYFGQPLINLLNMRAGDENVIASYSSKYKKTGRHFHDNPPLATAANNPLELNNTKPIKNAGYSYSNLAADVLTNYTMHRVGYDYEKFLTSFFHDKVKNEHPIYFYTMKVTGVPENWHKQRIDLGAGTYMFWATRYDYLRIANAMMEDWRNNTCEGRYLKEVYEHRISNGRRGTWAKQDQRWGYPTFGHTSSRYGGQFWTDINGLSGENVLVMLGYNGQVIAMNMDKERIVVINAAKDKHYNTKMLGYEPLKYGRIN